VAVLTALFAAMVSLGLGLSLVLLGNGETALAGHDRDARALRYASRAAAALAVSELRGLPSVRDVGHQGTAPELSAVPGMFVDSTLTPRAPWGGTLDLRALTARIQAESDAGIPGGVNHPIWRLFVYGSLARLASDTPAGAPCYLAAWVADDVDVLLVRAAALGPGESRAMTEMSLQADEVAGPGAALKILAVRPDP
jgi:hypothetical protein